MSKEDDGLNINVALDNRDGVSGKAFALGIAGSILVGALLGGWGIYSLVRFEPSEEYRANQAELELVREELGDSIRAAEELAEEVIRESEEILAGANATLVELDEARAVANASQRVADSLRNANQGEDVDLLLQENEALRVALSDREAECYLCAQAVSRYQMTIEGLRIGLAAREQQNKFLQNEIDALSVAVRIRDAEIDRATGRLGFSWSPHISFGYSIGLFDTLASDGYSFGHGPSVSVSWSLPVPIPFL